MKHENKNTIWPRKIKKCVKLIYFNVSVFGEFNRCPGW